MSIGALFLLGAIFSVGALVALFYALGIVGQRDPVVRERLKSGTSAARESTEPNLVVSDDEKVGWVGLFALPSVVTKIERDVLLAGRPGGWSVRTVLLLKPVLTLLALLLGAVVLSEGATFLTVGIAVVGAFAGYIAPDAIIRNRARTRQEEIQRDLADVLDQVTISIEAGLGFEAAFARIGERRKGPLAEEIVRAVQDMRLGMSRRDAYQAMADRTDVDEMRSFVRAVLQAEQYGVSIASVVRTQASEMRFRRRKRAEENALKVPVKILFPLLVCILPVLFVVVLTPAVISFNDLSIG